MTKNASESEKTNIMPLGCCMLDNRIIILMYKIYRELLRHTWRC